MLQKGRTDARPFQKPIFVVKNQGNPKVLKFPVIPNNLTQKKDTMGTSRKLRGGSHKEPQLFLKEI
jgi:hypothetical protein